MAKSIAFRNRGTGADILRGVVAAIAATGILVLVFALLISLFDFSDGVIRTVNQLIKLAAVYCGVWAAVPRGNDNGLLRGMLVGFLYMAAGVMVYALLTAQRLTALSYAADLLMGIAAGGLMGLLRAKHVARN